LPPEQVREDVIAPRQSHSSTIIIIKSGNEDVSNCDALVTQNHGFSLGVRTADCAPICFSDGKAIGIAHVGWRGLCLGLIEKMIPNFDTATLAVYVAPFLHSFEIQRDFCYEQITQKFGEHFVEQKDGKLIFNFKNAIGSLLPPHTVFDSRNTATDFPFPSYRRHKTSSRFFTVVSFSP
jgi:copper oxidase (laccase) domain-containing protein